MIRKSKLYEPVAKIQLSRDHSVHITNEVINTVTSMIGCAFALLGSTLLIVQAATKHQVWDIVGFSIYGLSLLCLFVSSSLHHGINSTSKVNRRLRTFDYAAVYFLIAGTITPVVLVRGRNPIGWSVLGVIWAIAITGITLRLVYHQLPKHVTNTLYIVLGWLASFVVAANLHFPINGYALLIIGGLIYSVGFALFVSERPNPIPGVFGFHEMWHLFVIGGSLCLYLMMYLYVAQY